MPTLVSLFDLSGTWSNPWKDAGWTVHQVDLQAGLDVMDLTPESYRDVDVVLAAPPCTHFTNSSTRHWKAYDADGRTTHSVALVVKTLELVAAWKPRAWALENPPGRIRTLVPALEGVPRFLFHPHEYAGYLDQSAVDPGPKDTSGERVKRAFATERYRKKTVIYGPCICPPKRPLDPLDSFGTAQTAITFLPRNAERANLRAVTPKGFSRAFFEANVGVVPRAMKPSLDQLTLF